MVKNLPANAGKLRNAGLVSGLGRSPGGENATHSSVLAWKTPWTEEPGGLQSTGSQRVGHAWVHCTALVLTLLLMRKWNWFCFMPQDLIHSDFNLISNYLVLMIDNFRISSFNELTLKNCHIFGDPGKNLFSLNFLRF